MLYPLAARHCCDSGNLAADTNTNQLCVSPSPASEVRCPSCSEDRLVEWDSVLRVWTCAVCGHDWTVTRG